MVPVAQWDTVQAAGLLYDMHSICALVNVFCKVFLKFFVTVSVGVRIRVRVRVSVSKPGGTGVES